MVLLHARQRLLLADLPVQVDDLVGEGGELVAEAHRVCAGRVGGERVVAVLLLHLVVQDAVVGSLHLTVDVVVTASDHLPPQERHATAQPSPVMVRPPGV